MLRRHWGALAAGLSSLDLGCAAIIDFPDDPQLFTQAELSPEPPRGCPPDPARPATTSAETARVRVQACDALRGCSTPVPELTARLCAKLDVDCASPLQLGISAVDGLFELDVPTLGMGFAGYLQVTSATELCTSPVFGGASPLLCSLVPQCNPEAPDDSCRVPLYAPALLFFNPPITSDVPEPLGLSLLSSAAMPGIVRAAGSDYDPTMGNLLVMARGCDGTPAAGIRYDLGEEQSQLTQLYMDSGVLSRARDATDDTGMGAFTGVRPGFASVVAYDGAGQRVGAVGVQVAPGTITYATLLPSR
ncbi:MAG: hypothetical protein ABI895_36145 [Deltaproteobacteria bacterium]